MNFSPSVPQACLDAAFAFSMFLSDPVFWGQKTTFGTNSRKAYALPSLLG